MRFRLQKSFAFFILPPILPQKGIKKAEQYKLGLCDVHCGYSVSLFLFLLIFDGVGKHSNNNHRRSGQFWCSTFHNDSPYRDSLNCRLEPKSWEGVQEQLFYRIAMLLVRSIKRNVIYKLFRVISSLAKDLVA